MKFGGFDWPRQPVVAPWAWPIAGEIEALFGGDVYIARNTIVSGERRILGFGDGARRWIFASSPGEGTESGRSACGSCTRRRSSFMSKTFPDLRSDEEADAWLKAADLSEYDLSGMKKVRFELARKDASISLRLPAALLATLKANAARANMPTQRLIRMMIEAQLAETGAEPKRKPQRKTRAPVRTGNRAA
jgi:predicted DNA binding CopG/RHH family protein